MAHLIESLEDRRLFAFGTNGVASLRFRVADASEAVHVEQILTDSAGNAYVTASTKTTYQIQKLTSAGTLDTAWGKSGSLLFVRTNKAGGAIKAEVDSANRLLVLQDDRLVRLAASGKTPDTTFANGAGLLNLADFDTVTDFSVDPGNKVYVTGSNDVGTKNVDTLLRVVRYISRGRRDTTFDNDGVYDLPFYKAAIGTRTGSSQGQFVRALEDGTAVVAGIEEQGSTGKRNTYTSTAVRAIKFTAAGALDAIYGTESGVRTVYKPQNDAETAFGLGIAGIRSRGEVVLIRSTSDGGLSGSDGDSLEEISATGKGSVDFDISATYTRANFGDAVGTKELAVVGNTAGGLFGVDLIETYGAPTSTFNGGDPLVVTYVSNAGAAAATLGDDAILTAGITRAGVRVTVAKLSLTGTIVTT